MTTKFTSTLAVGVLAASALALSACSGDDSTASSSNNASTPQAANAQSSTASTPATPAWLVGGKVDVAKVNQSDHDAVCTKLFGDVTTVGNDIQKAVSMNPSPSPKWRWGGAVEVLPTPRAQARQITCSPWDSANADAYDVEFHAAKSTDGRPIDIILPIKYFGYGPSTVKIVGTTAVYTKDVSAKLINDIGPKGGMSGQGAVREIDEHKEYGYALPSPPGTTMTVDRYIAKFVKNDVKNRAIFQPYIDKAAAQIAVS